MSNKVEKKNFDKYLSEAKSWETDRLIASEKSKKLAWIIASFAGILSLASILAVVGLTPLKKTELKIIRVDNSTGIVDVVTEIPNAKTNYSEAINKYFSQLYIRYREGYSRELAEEYYYDVGLLSTSAEQRRYGDYFSPKNPQSPLVVYGSTARIKIRVKSVSFIKDNVALVRYVKEIERGASERPAVSHWAATLVFKYSGAPMTEKDRAINPLGFQVSEYRNDPDSSTDDTIAAPIAQTTADQPTPSGAAGVTVFPGVPALPRPQVPAVATATAVNQ
jgi:type IV secretion system protein VirB8